MRRRDASALCLTCSRSQLSNGIASTGLTTRWSRSGRPSLTSSQLTITSARRLPAVNRTKMTTLIATTWSRTSSPAKCSSLCTSSTMNRPEQRRNWKRSWRRRDCRRCGALEHLQDPHEFDCTAFMHLLDVIGEEDIDLQDVLPAPHLVSIACRPVACAASAPPRSVRRTTR